VTASPELTVAVFESAAFEHAEPKEHWINPCCFGEDLAHWLAEELRPRGVQVEEPGQEDFGWYLDVVVNSERSCLVIGSDGEGTWYIVVERACGFVGSLLGGRHRAVGTRTVALLEEVLTDAAEVRDLRWATWKAFRRGDALAG
jgi:hypothetical protein